MIKNLIFLSLAFCFFFSCSNQKQLSDDEIEKKAHAIHKKAIMIDSHVDIPGSNYCKDSLDPGIDNPILKCDLVKMEKGGVDGVFLAIFSGQYPLFNDTVYNNAYNGAIDQFLAIRRMFKKYSKKCELAIAPDDVERIAESGKKAIMIGMENGYPIGEDLSKLEEFYDLGARYITLCHWDNNQICDASTSFAPKHDGLSEFGEEVVTEMNNLGMICDASHIAESSFWDLLKISRAPIIASHSACYSITPHKRNLNDRQLRALAENGGVIQIVAYPLFIESKKHINLKKRLLKELDLPDYETLYYWMSQRERDSIGARVKQFEIKLIETEKTIPDATIKDYVDHIDHAVKIAGIDHVGIGTDFDGGGGVPGFNSHADGLNVTKELLRRGYSEEDIIKILGGNLLRVWKEVENVSKES